MVLQKTDIFSWPYGWRNANTYLLYVLEFHSNLEMLLKCKEFECKLDLHEYILVLDNLPTLEDKKSRFYDLELSSWSMEQTLTSIIYYFMQEKYSLGGFKSLLHESIESHIKFICNNLYCDTIIEIYTFFNIFNLYPEQCILGCANFFSDYYSQDTKLAYLNHPGLKKFLNLLGIQSQPLNNIIKLCNDFQSSNFLALYLRKYNKKNYNFFSNQSLYDALVITATSCDYGKLENFLEKQQSSVDYLYLEINQLEKKRILNLVFKKIQNSNKIIFKMVYSVFMLGLSLMAAEILPRPSYSHYNSNRPYVAFAVIPAPNINRSFSSLTSGSVSGGVSHSQTSRQSSFVSASSLNESSPAHYTFEQEKEILREVVFQNKKSFFFKQFSKFNCFQTGSTSVLELRPSTASTEIPSAESAEVATFYDTSKSIIAGLRLKKKYVNPIIVQNNSTSVDLLFIKDSEQKVGNPVAGLNQHIIRKEFKPDVIKGLNLKNTYGYFLPNSKGEFNRVTLIGNISDCATSKELKKQFKKIVAADDAYEFVDNTFEHLLAEKWLATMEINRLPRSGVGDRSVGPLMSSSANRIMGRNQTRLLQRVINKYKTDSNFNFFSSNSKFTMDGLIDDWFQNHIESGLEEIREKAFNHLHTGNSNIQRAHAASKAGNLKKDSSKKEFLENWNKLSRLEKSKAVEPQLEHYLREQLDQGYSIIFDEALIPIYRSLYQRAFPYSLGEVNQWCRGTGLQAEQIPSYFCIRSVVNQSKSQIHHKLGLIAYTSMTPDPVPCPLETCTYHFKQQTLKTKLLREMCFHMEESWSEINTNNNRLSKLVTKEQMRMEHTNELLLTKAHGILTNLQEEQNASGNEILNFVDKDGNKVSDINFQEYQKKFETEINKFAGKINEKDWETNSDSPLSSPRTTFTRLVNQENESLELYIDVQTGLRSSFKPTKFILSVKSYAERPPESYPLEQLASASREDLFSSEESGPSSYN